MTIKLTLEDARTIRARRAAGESVESLARAFGVSLSSIREIVNGLRFREGAPAPSARSPGNSQDRIIRLAQRGPLSDEAFKALSFEDQITYVCTRAMLFARARA